MFYSVLKECEDANSRELDISPVFHIDIIVPLFVQNFSKVFETLETIVIVYSNFSKIETLHPCKLLKNIYCSMTRITRLSPGIEHFTNLEILNCEYNGLSNLEGIENLKNLKELSCHSNREIENLKEIENLENLILLDCSECSIKNVKFLERLVKLKILYISENPVESLEGIENTKRLEKFECSRTNINSFFPLRNHGGSLKSLSIEDNINMKNFLHLGRMISLEMICFGFIERGILSYKGFPPAPKKESSRTLNIYHGEWSLIQDRQTIEFIHESSGTSKFHTLFSCLRNRSSFIFWLWDENSINKLYEFF